MKKLFLASVIVFGTLGLTSCGETGTTAEEGKVIDTETTVSEVEVEKTVVETDTVTETETVDVENR